MPVTPFIESLIGDTLQVARSPMTEAIPLSDVAKVDVLAMRATEIVDGGIDGLQPYVWTSQDGGYTWTGWGGPIGGYLSKTAVKCDEWVSAGDHTLHVDLSSSNFNAATHFMLGIQGKTGQDREGHCRYQLNYRLTPRGVQRVALPQSLVAAGAAPKAWRISGPVQPGWADVYMQARLEVHALVNDTGSGTPSIRPMWFYNDSPGDEAAWMRESDGTEYLAAPTTTVGTVLTEAKAVSSLTDHLQVAFGFEVDGGTGNGFALVSGEFMIIEDKS